MFLIIHRHDEKFFNQEKKSRIIKHKKEKIMSNNSIAITTLAPEVQLRVNSNPDKYNPNYNDKIDPNELSTLLSDFQRSPLICLLYLQSRKQHRDHKINDHWNPQIHHIQHIDA